MKIFSRMKAQLDKRRLLHVLAQARDVSRNQPQPALCYELTQLIDLVALENYNANAGAALWMTPLYSNIELYTQRLKETYYLLRDNRVIAPDWAANLVPQRVSFDRFLVSNDGHYVDVQTAIGEFRKASIQLTEFMKGVDTVTPGIMEHNLRMLTKLFTSLREVLLAMVDISLN